MVGRLLKYQNNGKYFIVNKRILMMTLLHGIEHLPNVRFHHKRIEISTPLIVSHGYISSSLENNRSLNSSYLRSPPLALCPSSELLICVAVMLKCSVRHYERQISCFSCRRTHAERLVDLCPSWWRTRAGASGTPYSCGLWWWVGGGWWGGDAWWGGEVNRTEWLFISRCSRGNGHVLLLQMGDRC